MTKLSWAERLKRWRKRHEEEYAQAIMEPPEKKSLFSSIPFPGLVLIMGARGKGKSGLAHFIAEVFHKRKELSAVLHLPTAPPPMRRAIQQMLPKWMKVTTRMQEWPSRCVVIYDETAQGQHARRTQSGDALELENLIGISRQRLQTIIFISHHSRKIDPNIIRDIDRIIWKTPTFAHWIFERNEFTDFVLKAVDFFKELTPRMQYKTTLVMDFHNFKFAQFTNGLPEYWSEHLSRLFENLKNTKKGVESGEA